jgi:DNA-binding transcriptional LysR family regulator
MDEVQSAERDLAKLARAPARTLRIALECHTCFDWLMPIMDVFRKDWPEVELDLVSGFHPNPIALLENGKTDLVIGSENKPRRGIVFHPLFRFEVLAVLPTDHPLRDKRYLSPGDFARETLITYPVREADRPDPAGPQAGRRAPQAADHGAHGRNSSTGRQPPGGGGIAELGNQELCGLQVRDRAEDRQERTVEQSVRGQRARNGRAGFPARFSGDGETGVLRQTRRRCLRRVRHYLFCGLFIQ